MRTVERALRNKGEGHVIRSTQVPIELCKRCDSHRCDGWCTYHKRWVKRRESCRYFQRDGK
jgi:hypothetical protein